MKKEFIFSEVNKLNGIGPQLTKYLKKRKIEKIKDIILNLPYSETDRSKIVNLNSLEVLNTFTQKDILFIDPMFEVNSKSLAKKEIQFLRKCITSSLEKEIIDASIKSSAGLIVIKRHKLSNTRNSTKPSYVIKGKVISLEVFDRRGL